MPVGLGANRTRTFIVALRCVGYERKASVEERGCVEDQPQNAGQVTYPSNLRSASCTSTLLRRSEEHTSELQSHSFISYAVFCLKKKKTPSFSPTSPPPLPRPPYAWPTRAT